MAQADPTSIKVYAYISPSWVELDDRGGSVNASGSLGMSDNKPTTRIADPGKLTVILNNQAGLYTPGGPSVLAGWEDGIPFKMVITYDGIDYTYPYTIDGIQPIFVAGDSYVEVSLVSWMQKAIDFPIINPDLLEDVTADEAITSILATMPVQPASTNLGTGLYVFPTVSDTIKEHTNAYSEFTKLSLSETGFIYEKANGELNFESADFRNGARSLSVIPVPSADIGFLIKESDGGYLLKESDGGKLMLNQTETILFENMAIAIDAPHGKHVINHWQSSAYPKRVDTESVALYETETPIPLQSGETKEFRIFFTSPNGKNRINAIPPVEDNYTKSYLDFEGDGVNAPVVDAIGKTWTNGGIELLEASPTFTPIVGSRSGYFDGTTSWIESPQHVDWEFGSGDFTVKWKEYRFNATSGATVFSRDYSAGFPAFMFGYSDGTNSLVYISSNGSSWDIANGVSFGAHTLNTWVDFEVTRRGNNFYLFKAGTLITSFSSSSAIFSTASKPLSIGRNGTTYLTACIDEVVIKKGIADHIATYTPLTTAFQLSGTFSSMWSAVTLSGTDLSQYLDLTIDYGTNGATLTLYNSGATKGWVYININGYGIYSDSALVDTQSDSTSIATRGYKNENIYQQYQYVLDSAILEGKKHIELEKNPRTVLNSVSFCANKSAYLMSAFLNIDIGDLVRIKQDNLSIDGWYYVQGIEFEMKGKIIMFKWIVRQAFLLASGLSMVACEFRGGVTTDAINFGHIPIVSQDRISHRAFSAWVYLDGPTTADVGVVISNHSDNGGVMVYFNKTGSDMYLRYYNSLYAGGSAGGWSANTKTNTGAWYHVFVSQDTSPSPTTDPLMFQDGVLLAITEGITPSGALDSDYGNPVIVGNIKTSTIDYEYPFDGKIKDVRIYDMDQQGLTPAALAAAIYAEGAGGTAYYDGMVFQAFAVRTSELTDYTDLTLTSSTKLLDAYLGYVGTPNGSPISRIP